MPADLVNIIKNRWMISAYFFYNIKEILKTRWRCQFIIKNIRVNEQIRIPKVRLIAEDGSQVGIIATGEALIDGKGKRS